MTTITTYTPCPRCSHPLVRLPDLDYPKGVPWCLACGWKHVEVPDWVLAEAAMLSKARAPVIQAVKTCDFCGKEFNVDHDRKLTQRFCSYRCMYQGRRPRNHASAEVSA